MKAKRDFHRRIRRNSTSSAGIVRSADGQLRAAHEADIGDVWAQQKRLQLQEAILADKKKRAKQERRRGLFGAFKTAPIGRGQDGAKTVEIKIQMPSIPWQDAVKAFKPTAWKHARVKPNKKQKIIAASLAALAVVAISGIGVATLTGGHNESPERGGVLGQDKRGPSYSTLLPAGKSIDDLGGWGRVSPPDKDPVYAFIDTIDNVRINVSQQPIPDNFKNDTAAALKNLAESFSANEEVAIGGATAYIGTSAQGPQSVLFAKDKLLILIKSEAELTKEQWTAYLISLQ